MLRKAIDVARKALCAKLATGGALLGVVAILWSCGSVTTSAPQPTGGGTVDLAPETETQATTQESETGGQTATTDTVYKYTVNNWYEFPEVNTKSDWSSGSVSFKLTGMSYDSLPAGADAFIFMAKLITPNGSEGNFQFNIADLTPRLISQRFDGTCASFCENQSHGSVYWDAAETYSFVITWSSSLVTCIVTDSAGNTVYSGSVPTDGAYAGVDWVRVGNGVMPPYGGSSSEITIINPTLW